MTKPRGLSMGKSEHSSNEMQNINIQNKKLKRDVSVKSSSLQLRFKSKALT